MNQILRGIALLPLLHASLFAQAKESAVPGAEKNRGQLETHFENQLSGATLLGHSTQEGEPSEKSPAEERYTIRRVAKIPFKNKLWKFDVRLQFGKVDLTIPLPLTVEWAGDTPVITLTDYSIPGLGSFSARVLFYGDRYAGTWQHGKVGGHLYGKIVREEQSDDEKSKSAAKEKPE
jgi:hypothetical protein